jgi:hypothetical protein
MDKPELPLDSATSHPDASSVESPEEDSPEAEEMDRPSEKSTISEIDAALRRLVKDWNTVKKARKNWDFKTALQSLGSIGGDIRQVADQWSSHEGSIATGIEADQAFMASEAYPLALETALRDVGVPIKGKFPVYEFPPFKLTIALENGYARLGLGRRSQQTRSLQPEQVAAWVSKEYRRLMDSRFDSARFCKDLLNAYECANRLVMRSAEVVWGSPIMLKDIYRLLTLKQATKQEYPEALFTYDLARLKEQVEMVYDGRKFELIPSRESASSYVLVNSQGQESRVQSLTIHDRDGDATG